MQTDIATIAKAIKMPTSEWQGQCSAVCYMILKRKLAPPGTVYRYGHYFGPVAPANLVFSSERVFQRHAWLELPDGSVCDPSRWAFEGMPPSVWLGDYGREYDAGGNCLWWTQTAGYPEPGRRLGSGQREEELELSISGSAFNVLRRIVWAFGGLIASSPLVRLNYAQSAFFANCPPQWLGLECAAEYYGELERIGQDALIKADHQRDVLDTGRLAPLFPDIPAYGVLDPRENIPNPLRRHT